MERGNKLNVNKTFWSQPETSPECLIYVQFTVCVHMKVFETTAFIKKETINKKTTYEYFE